MKSCSAAWSTGVRSRSPSKTGASALHSKQGPHRCRHNKGISMTDKDLEIPVKVVDRRWWARGDDGAPAERSSKPSYVEELEQQLAEKDRLAREYIAKYRQAASEFEESRLRLRR